jgi:uncharacterized protein (TIGR02231 family)
MNRILTFLFFLTSIGLSAQKSIDVSVKTTHITVFTNRAQIETEVKASLAAGSSKIVISDVASTIDPNSIQVSGKGDFTLLSVNFEKDFISKRVLTYQDSLKAIDAEMEELTMTFNVLELEEKMVMDNTKIKSDTDDLYKDDLEDMSQYFKRKLTGLGIEKLKNKRSRDKLLERKTRIENQMKTDPSRQLPLGKIILTVKANSATSAIINLNYIAYGAGWRPIYDVRVENTESPLNLSYKADVFQNTGVNWGNVNLTLSTASVNKQTTKPELNPNFLYFYESRSPVVSRASAKMKVDMEMSAPMVMMEAANMGTAANYAEVVETSLNTKFDITIPYSIASGKTETVEIQNLTIIANYATYVVPKFDKNGFLIAEINDWERYNLIPAMANVYFEGAFIGKTYIGNPGVKNELKISLGRDERIQVKRDEIKDYKTRKTFGSNIRENFGYDIIIRNTKKETANVIIEDQMPVSQDSDIEVEMEELSNGVKDENTGKITWSLSVPASQSRQVSLKYSVKYSKDKNVVNL